MFYFVSFLFIIVQILFIVGARAWISKDLKEVGLWEGSLYIGLAVLNTLLLATIQTLGEPANSVIVAVMLLWGLFKLYVFRGSNSERS